MSEHEQDPKIARMRAMVERFPDRSVPHFGLAQALHNAGDHDGAEASYAEAYRCQTDLMMAYFRRGECLVALERFEDVVQVPLFTDRLHAGGDQDSVNGLVFMLVQFHRHLVHSSEGYGVVL